MFRLAYTAHALTLVIFRLAYTAHALNHVLKTRTKILNNNTKHEKRGEKKMKID